MDEIVKLRSHASHIEAVAMLISNQGARATALNVAARWRREAEERLLMLRSAQG